MTALAAPAEPVPVAFLGRTSTLVLQDPGASLRRQLRQVDEKLPAGWFIAAHFWDVESGGLDLEDRGHGTAHEKIDARIPRDGGLAALLAEAGGPSPRFAAVMCEDIERSGRDTYNALKLEKRLSAVGIPLLACDEPIDIAGMNATTILVRRIKQGIAEWYRFQVKEKAWNGFREHAIDGYNIGYAPYGYAAHRIPHPAPGKAAQGRTKTRLVLDPVRAPVVAQMFTWRTIDKLAFRSIAVRLNADPGRYPPPGEKFWQPTTVARILANPKYTGYMVYGRRRSQNGRAPRAVPAGQWLWSPGPAHPAIISRETWDAAQAAGAEHSSSRDAAEPPSHPAAKRAYALRSVIRCRDCRRRMNGRTKYARGHAYTYYGCPHDPANPRHTAVNPDHPGSVQIREDALMTVITEFFDTRIFGPDRATLTAAALPAEAADAARQRDTQTTALHQRLRQIDAAENAHAREIEELAHHDAGSPAVTALRTRILARFGELETERAAITTRLAALTATAPAANDPALLDALPRLAGLIPGMPVRLQQQLYQAFGLQLLYNNHDHQITIHATITPATPRALAAIISDSEPPATPTAATPDYDVVAHSLHAPVSWSLWQRTGWAAGAQQSGGS